MSGRFTVGFIGIGMMGAPMAACLAAAGWPLRIFDPRAEALAPFAGREGVTLAASLAEAAAGAALVITMLPDGKIVRAAVLGPEGLAGALAPGAVLADMSTSYPLETKALSEALAGTGIGLVDAPVSGGVGRAERGKLTIMAGGEGAVIERIEGALSALGTVYRTGPLGSGHAMKVLNNYLSASGLAAACEAVLIGRRFGLDPDLMADVFNVSTGRSNATEVKLKQQVNNGKYAAGFTMELMSKDLRMAAALAGDLGVEAKGLAACAELYARALEVLGGKADHTEIMKLIEGEDIVNARR
ncbi:MAG: NAD(P)-dependent oxidoreductase [Proteobacteria bacterium]|nr:NAD(P)-dependent oxidoreductase [Pseudomonadota bacterium]MCH8952382.1 NAD(P)-dependent oxidoreductase [Pseudomonadota bacterium]